MNHAIWCTAVLYVFLDINKLLCLLFRKTDEKVIPFIQLEHKNNSVTYLHLIISPSK